METDIRTTGRARMYTNGPGACGRRGDLRYYSPATSGGCLRTFMHRGYVKFWRKILDWEWFSCSETFHLFAYLFLAANHSDGNYKGIEVKRGQLLTGRKSISEKTGISQRSVRTSLKRLKSTGEITVKTTNKFSIITLCNYETYNPYDSKNDQQTDQQTDQQVTSKRPANDQQVTTNKNYKNEKNEKNIIPPTLEMVSKYCIERGNGIDPQAFIDHYAVRGWIPKGYTQKMKDWQAAIRTWEKSKNKYQNQQPAESRYKDDYKPNHPPKEEQMTDEDVKEINNLFKSLSDKFSIEKK